MTTVSDASPVSYLVLVRAEDVLPALYGELLIPEAVHRELAHPQGPEPVHSWIETSPSWLNVESVSSADRKQASNHGEGSLQSLDPGGREAILLAENRGAGLLLIDERAGPEAARNRDLEVTGTIKVLGAAVKKGRLDAAQVVEALRAPTFRASLDLYR